jgi:alpha-ribazole phosphatase
LIARSRNASRVLPQRGTVLVISHGGPIAALRWHASGLPVPQIVDFIPALGAFIEHEV